MMKRIYKNSGGAGRSYSALSLSAARSFEGADLSINDGTNIILDRKQTRDLIAQLTAIDESYGVDEPVEEASIIGKDFTA